MSAKREDRDDVYRPDDLLRGGVSPAFRSESDDGMKHKWGRQSRGSTFGLQLQMADGHLVALYGMFAGSPWMNPDATLIEIPVQGHIRIGGKWHDGQQGEHLIIIRGKRLQQVFDYIGGATCAFAHPCAEVADEPFIAQPIEIVPLEFD